MSANYDPTLPSGLDWVRFLTRDTDTAAAALSDEEITALLAMQTATGQAAYYFAAAEALQILRAGYATAGEGVTSKTVEHLEKTWGMDRGVVEAIDCHISFLRRRGAFLLSRVPRTVRAVGRSSRDVRFSTE